MIIEAKIDPERPFRTILTRDHFREILRFEEWLNRVEYSGFIPGIPYGSKNIPGFPGQKLMQKDVPKSVTFYDMCKKDGRWVKAWPEDTPEDCRLAPTLCP